MACEWRVVGYSKPPVGLEVLVKYNIVRSDSPFTYVVAKYSGVSWKVTTMSGGYLGESIIPEPNFWAFIEKDHEHV